MSGNEVELQQLQLPDIQRRTRSGRAFAPADTAPRSDGHGGSANDGSDSDDTCGWPKGWNMVELIPEDYDNQRSADKHDASTGSSAPPARPPPRKQETGYMDDPDPTWTTATVRAARHMNEQLGAMMGLTPVQHLLGLQCCADEEKVSDSDDSNDGPSLERSSGSDNDDNDNTDGVQSGFRDNGQTRTNQSGGGGSS